MKKQFPLTRAFTLVETTVGSMVMSMILGSVVMGSLAMRRNLSIATFHATAQNEQLRVFDYLGKDLRSATNVIVLDQGRRVNMKVPNHNPNLLAIHVEFPVLGSLQNTNASATRNVAYYLEGDRLIREEEGVQTELARTVTDFQICRTGAAAEVTTVFSPRFARSTDTNTQRAVRSTSFVFLRNVSGS